ncbi:uncharacterized protein LOC122855510 [Aphidius gifuensis]|uniref:uncharacterized protein LOC122855510 n=1 Tax=Aphidius gifuensis TaxID=684658 RepID=UPI001CDD8D8D|nr:uncharacterized protein LOC122855510 [Aphidius gifuensis]
MVVSDSDSDDSMTKTTEMNTVINKSGVYIKGKEINDTPKPKSRKSVLINESLLASTPVQNGKKIRKSILKKPDESRINEDDLNTSNNLINSPSIIISQSASPTNILKSPQINTEEKITKNKTLSRPHNLEDFFYNEDLEVENKLPTYTIDDVDKDDELWIMEIPKTIDVNQLIGQVIIFGDKTTLKLDNGKKYHGHTENNDELKKMTCVFSAGQSTNEYVNASLCPSGTVTLRRKLSAKKTSQDME